MPNGMGLRAGEVRGDEVTPDQEAAARLALEIGSEAAAAKLGLSPSQIGTLRQRARTQPWHRQIREAALALSKQIGPRQAARALKLQAGTMRQWRREGGLCGAAESGMYARDKCKAECVECGKSMSEAGLCSDECRRDFIEAEGRA